MVHVRFEHVELDESLAPALPPLVRLLGERANWATSDANLEGFDILERALSRAAATGTDEYHAELCSYLTVPMVQAALSTGSDVLGRHLCLATFRESVARTDSLFFNSIWPWAKWSRRTECLGDQLEGLFHSLHRVFLELGSIQPVIEILSWHRDDSETDSAAEVRRAQSTELLAARLEKPPGMRGHYRRLRMLACTQFFQPLILDVRRRDWKPVLGHLRLLQRRHEEGELVDEVVEKLREQAEARGLGREHRRSARRFIDGLLKELQNWVDAERQYEQGEAQEKRAAREDEARDAVERFLAVEVGVDSPPAEVGTVAWLLASFRRLIADLQEGESPQPSPVRFGEIDLDEDILEWQDPDPRDVRIWIGHLGGRIDWRDVLQDRIAAVLLNTDRSGLALLEFLIDAREFEAAVEAAHHPSLAGISRAQELVEKAEAQMDRQRQLEDRLDAIFSQVEALHSRPGSEDSREPLSACETKVLEAREEFDQGKHLAAEDLISQLERILPALTAEVQGHDREEREKSRQYRSWLAEAGFDVEANTPVDELERRVETIRQAAWNRRRHLLRLKKLDKPQVPESLRAAVRTLSCNLDRPGAWPNEQAAETADFYTELVVKITDDWWPLLRALEPDEATVRRLQSIADLMSQRLADELAAILSDRLEEAPILGALLERGSNRVAEYHRMLVNAGLLKPEEMPIVLGPPSGADSLERSFDTITPLVESISVPRGSGRSVERAATAFRRKDAQASMQEAAAAWAWCRKNGKEEHKSLLLGIFGWSYDLENPDAQAAGRDAIGLLLRSHDALARRAAVRPDSLLEWWLKHWGMNTAETRPGDFHQRLGEYLKGLTELPAGSQPRTHLTALLRTAGADQLSDLLWQSLTGVETARTKGRIALLRLLYDLGEDEALKQLFES